MEQFLDKLYIKVFNWGINKQIKRLNKSKLTINKIIDFQYRYKDLLNEINWDVDGKSTSYLMDASDDIDKAIADLEKVLRKYQNLQ